MTKLKVNKTKLTSTASRVDFDKSKFSTLIKNKGYDVIHEKALQCPCKSQSSSAQSNCNNCGGTGWFFVNPDETKAIIHSANRITEYKDWSQENIGTISVTVEAEDEISFMDRFVILRDCEGKELISMYNEAKYLRYSESNNELYSYLTYNILSIEYVGIFIAVDQKLQRVDNFSFENNILKINDQSIIDMFDQKGELSLTVRYNHSPQFHVIDLTREFMLTQVQEGRDRKKVNMPVSCLARRAHYIDGMESYSGNKVFDNSYKEEGDC